MRRTLGLLAALLMAAGITLVAPAPAHAASYTTTHDGPEVCRPDCPIAHMRVKIYSHDGPGSSIIVDDVQFGCEPGNCGNLDPAGWRDVTITIRGSSGALLKNYCCFNLARDAVKHFYPNLQMGKSAQWFIDGNMVGGTIWPDEYFKECGAMHPSVPNPNHNGYGCVYTVVT